MAQLLIVEDDLAIRSSLSRALTERGHAVASAGLATTALAMVESSPPDLLLLDLGLPDLDGMQMLRMLRAVSSVPVIVATARDDERAVVAALDAGADDYVIKPFSAMQVDARIRAVLRRVSEDHPREPLRVGQLCVDAASRAVFLGDRPLSLSRKEFDLLLYLAQRPGDVVSKRELLTQVWQHTGSGADKTVDVHLSWLRQKLGESGAAPRYLHTVRGVGVKLVDPEMGGDPGEPAPMR